MPGGLRDTGSRLVQAMALKVSDGILHLYLGFQRIALQELTRRKRSLTYILVPRFLFRILQQRIDFGRYSHQNEPHQVHSLFATVVSLYDPLPIPQVPYLARLSPRPEHP